MEEPMNKKKNEQIDIWIDESKKSMNESELMN